MLANLKAIINRQSQTSNVKITVYQAGSMSQLPAYQKVQKAAENYRATMLKRWMNGELVEVVADDTKSVDDIAEGTGNVVTAQQLKDFGWADTSDEFVERLNKGLIRYGITDKNSIAFFMATMAEESGRSKYSYEIRSDFSKSSYNSNDRGAGYIQITHRETHLAFLKSMGDDFSGADTATYISENYALESALWFWSSEKAKSTSVGSLNDYVETYGSGKGVFLITQYYVNGWPSGNNTNTNLAYIRNGGSFDDSSGRLRCSKLVLLGYL
jgi:hypothetical protein